MTFFTEPTSYKKTILSDLQGGWQVLRELVVEHAGFEGWDRMLFHIDEAMSWETVRHLDRMGPLLTLIKNIAVQAKVSKEITECINDIHRTLDEIYTTIKSGQDV